MGIDGNRWAVAAWACVAAVAVRTANAAQRTTTLADPTGTTLHWATSVDAPPARASEAPPPPALLPALEETIANEEHGARAACLYGTRGVLELGGFASFSGAGHFTSIQVSPTVGWFLFDDVELSAMVGFNYVRETIDAGTATERSSRETIIRILGEPSYHVVLSPTVWGFVGVGLGVASVLRGSGRTSAGFDVASRAGVNVLVGRTGLLTPAAFVDHARGVSTYGMQAGYTVMW